MAMYKLVDSAERHQEAAVEWNGNAITFLKHQHNEIGQIFDRLEHSMWPREKEMLVRNAAGAIATHLSLEERCFYPAIHEPYNNDVVLEFHESHFALKTDIAHLLDVKADEPHFDDNVSAFVGQVRAHFREEEDDLFPSIQRLLGDDELLDLGLFLRKKHLENSRVWELRCLSQIIETWFLQ